MQSSLQPNRPRTLEEVAFLAAIPGLLARAAPMIGRAALGVGRGILGAGRAVVGAGRAAFGAGRAAVGSAGRALGSAEKAYRSAEPYMDVIKAKRDADRQRREQERARREQGGLPASESIRSWMGSVLTEMNGGVGLAGPAPTPTSYVSGATTSRNVGAHFGVPFPGRKHRNKTSMLKSVFPSSAKKRSKKRKSAKH